MSGPPLELAGERLAALRAYHTPPDPPAIKLDANESPWPLPAPVRAAIAARIAEAPLHRYPDLGARALRAALAGRLGAAPEQLLLGVGSDEVIGMLMTAFDRPRAGATSAAVLYPTPSFVMYPITARVHGLTPIEVPLDARFGLDLDATLHAIEAHRPNLVFLASPNNPTGNLFDEGALAAIADAAPDALVVIDEAYAPFAGRSLGAWVDARPNVAVMGTLSKIGLAGLRLGWARMHPELVREAEKVRPPYNLASPTQLVAELLLTAHADELDAQVTRIVEARAALASALAALPDVRVFPSAANFVLVEVDDAARVHAGLLERGVAVRRFPSDPRLARHLRVTVGTPDENRALLDAWRALSLAPPA